MNPSSAIEGRDAVETVELLGSRVAATTLAGAAARLHAWVEERRPRYVCVADAHLIMQGRWNVECGRALRGADMITTDGMPLVWFCRLEGHAGTERVYGPDLLLAVCEAGLSSGRRHCFYGGAPGVAEALADRLKARFPGLQVAAAISPPFSNGPTDADAARGAAAVIDACAPDFVWVGLGAPKQEIWMADHRPYLKAPVLVGVGAAFDFLSGARPQAPAVMRRFGLEWLFRLASEPRRLWPRYSRVAPAFLYHVARQRLRRSVRQGG